MTTRDPLDHLPRATRTGTGKTYTMEGDTASEEHQGVIPRAVREVFERLEQREYLEATVKVSYLEIYNEELGDLLADYSNGGGGDPMMTPSSGSRHHSGGRYSSSASSSSGSSYARRSGSMPSFGAGSGKLTITEDKRPGGRGVYCHGLTEVGVPAAFLPEYDHWMIDHQ